MMGTSKNSASSPNAIKLPANDSASFSFRFIYVHSGAVSDRQWEQFFEVPLSLCELLHIQPPAFSSKWAEGRRRRQLYRKPPCDTLRRGAANTSQALIACSRTFAECEVAHTSLLAHFSKIRLIDLGPGGRNCTGTRIRI